MSNSTRFMIIGGVVLLIVAGLLVFLLSGNSADDTTTGSAIDEVPEERVIEDRNKEETRTSPKNAAAEGLSKFYASLNADMGEGPQIRNNVVYLPDPKGDLIAQLDAMRMVTRPLNRTWRGTVESRSFRKGETLFQNLSKYGNDDGIEIIWWLNRDFVVKDPFRINKNIVKTAYQIGSAVSGHFPEGLRTYFCFQQRVVILISENLPYLDEECILLTPETR